MSGLEQAIRNALERAERSNPEIRSRIYQSARNALDAGLRKQDIDDDAVIERQRQRLEITIRAIEDEELEKLRLAARLEKVFIESTPFEPEHEPEPVAGTPDVMPEPDVPQLTPKPQTADILSGVIEHQAEPRKPEPIDSIDGSLSDFSATRDERRTSFTPKPEKRVVPERAARKGKRAVREEEDPVWAEASTPEGRSVAPEKRAARRRSSSWVVSLFVYCVLIGIIAFGAWWVYATGMIGAALHGTGNFDLIPK